MDVEPIHTTKVEALADIFRKMGEHNLPKPTEIHTGIAIGRTVTASRLDSLVEEYEDQRAVPVAELVEMYRSFKSISTNPQSDAKKEKGITVGYRRSEKELGEFIEDRVEGFTVDPDLNSAESESLSATVSQDISEHLGSGPDEAVEKNSSAEDVFNLGDNNE